MFRRLTSPVAQVAWHEQEDAKTVEYVRRPERLGLGAEPGMTNNKKPKKYIKVSPCMCLPPVAQHTSHVTSHHRVVQAACTLAGRGYWQCGVACS